jgi:hypothetical protein
MRVGFRSRVSWLIRVMMLILVWCGMRDGRMDGRKDG